MKPLRVFLSFLKRPVFAVLFFIMIYTNIQAQIPFTPIDTNFSAKSVILPEGYKYTLLFREDDEVVLTSGEKAPSLGDNDYNCYVPMDGSNVNGYLLVNHETTKFCVPPGSIGPITILHVRKENGEWKTIGDKRSVDFSGVGGTWYNCAGGNIPTAWGTVLSVEEYPPSSNRELEKYGWPDTTDFNGYPRYLNLGFMLEINPVDLSVKKLYSMGRFSHEAALLMEDNKTVYMTDDYAPGLFFKFVADNPGNYETGQLYAYKQTGKTGTWIALPRERDSLNYARDVALRRGATIFIRMEDIAIDNDGNIYITETGRNKADMSEAMNMGGVPVEYLEKLRVPGTDIFNDYYGRLLKFDESTGEMSVFLEGGMSADGKTVFSNPDNIAMDKSRNILLICEDVNGISEARNPEWVTADNSICEIYYLDLSVKEPALEDLKRFAIIPAGAESTGPFFTPDYEALFLGVQDPNKTSLLPFDRSCTIVITGFD